MEVLVVLRGVAKWLRSLCLSVAGMIMLAVLSAPAYAEQKKPEFLINDIQLVGEIPIEQSAIDRVTQPYLGQTHTLDGLRELSAVIQQTMHDQGYSFYRVVLPEQQLGEQGRVTFKVVSFTLRNVAVEGNQFFATENILASLPGLSQGASPNSHALTRELQVAAYHPLKDLRLTFKKSPAPDSIDAVVNVTDAEAENIALVLANTGNSETGDARLTLSYQDTNVGDKDHILNLSYTTSPGHFSDVKQYGGSYAMPFYDRGGWLTLYAVRSDVNTGTVGSLDISGAGTMYGAHYLHALPRRGGLEHWLNFGFDNKLFENDILFGGTSLVPDVRSAPVSLTYRGKFPWKNNLINYSLQGAVNTSIGGDNNTAAYTNNRTNADRGWSAVRYGATLDRMLGEWGFKFSLSGQYTNDVLISGEQFGLGGSTSVRGYEEREISRDVGYQTSVEVVSPAYNNTRFIGFWDYGYGFNRDVQPGDPAKHQRVASLGVGLRWQLEKKAMITLDFAHALKDGAAGSTESGENKIHARLVVNF